MRTLVPSYLGVATIVLMLGMVLMRLRLMKKQGITAMHFGNIDKKDFVIPPLAFFYFYTMLANAFNFPSVSKRALFQSLVIPWIGVFICLAGLALLSWSLVSFGKSFRVGIDIDHPSALVTRRVFAVSRNPIYVAFTLILVGEFLIFPNWLSLLYIPGAIWLFHRQVLREEVFLKEHYGLEYIDYCQRVRRYI